MISTTFFPKRFAKSAIVSLFALSAGLASAQEENRIKLRSLDGAMSLEGAFIGYRDGVYVIDHVSLGTLRIEGSDDIVCEGAACPGNEPAPEPEPEPEPTPEPEPQPAPEPVVIAPEPEPEPEVSRFVELKTADGRLAIDGDFVEMNGKAFIIDSPTMGRLSIAMIPGMECFGLACPEMAPPGSEKLIAGTTREIADLLPLLLDGYAAAIGATVQVSPTNENGEIPVSLIGGGGDLADFLIATRSDASPLSRLSDNTASLVLSDRRISETDVAASVPDLRGTADEQKVALDGLVLVTSADNPIRSLSTTEVSQLWSGAITNWKALGGTDAVVGAASALTDARDRALFGEKILAPNGANASLVTEFASASNLIATLQSDPGAIGVMRRSEAINRGLNLIELRETCGLLSSPSAFDIKNGGYVLGTEVYSYLSSELASPQLSAFAAWLGTDEANALVDGAGYVNSNPSRMVLQDLGLSLIHTAIVEEDFDGKQFASVMQALSDAERSSATFRFNEGSAILDVDSLSEIGELAQQIKSGAYDGYEVLLVGFSDSSGPSDINTALALARATQVQSALGQALAGNGATTLVTPISAGELLPMSCNTTADGRERNRRVETWIRLNK